jgi:hypothetical protein
MHARVLGVTAIATALVLLPSVAHADGPEAPPAATTVVPHAGIEDRPVAGTTVGDAAGVPTGSLVVLGLVSLVGGALVLVLRGRRQDDDSGD